jgi:FlaA1/EpsC-like NDP-sugar epimerase
MVTFRKNKGLKNVLIVGAGEGGVLMAKEMLKSSNANLRPVAFVDDDAAKIGNKMYGISVLGTIEDIPRLVLLKRIDEIVITMPSVSGDVIRRVVEFCTKTGKPFKIIPAIYDLLSGKVNMNALREVAVEDLLRRKPVNLDTIEIEKYISSRTVLVTGAGGSIGSELVRQICRFNPKHIVLVGRGENSIFEMKRSLRNELLSISHSTKIADIRDFSTLEHIFKEQKPEVIFHAAAHKHVPLMEENPAQAVLNNVIGTRNLVNLAVDYGVNYFVNISTDKAVNPTSVMGASKRISEQVVKWGALQANKGEIFVSVRFGNVLGSRGSVIPIFKDQIKSGGPVTVTHPDMIRYFMTIPEASQLVLQAAALKENGSIFVLDMGDPVNISDMARDLIKLSGLEPDKDVKIEYTGVRPGEKMFEELLTAEEGTGMTKYDKVFVAKNGYAYDEKEFSVKLDELLTLALEGDETKIREKIYEMVPSFTGTEAQMS